MVVTFEEKDSEFFFYVQCEFSDHTLALLF